MCLTRCSSCPYIPHAPLTRPPTQPALTCPASCALQQSCDGQRLARHQAGGEGCLQTSAADAVRTTTCLSQLQQKVLHKHQEQQGTYQAVKCRRGPNAQTACATRVQTRRRMTFRREQKQRSKETVVAPPLAHGTQSSMQPLSELLHMQQHTLCYGT